MFPEKLKTWSLNSGTRVLLLCRKFLLVKKGVMSMELYKAHVQKMLDDLIAIGEIVKESEVVLTIIDGLEPEYTFFITSLTTRFDHAITSVDLQAIRMDQEINGLTTEFDSPISINVLVTSCHIPILY